MRGLGEKRLLVLPSLVYGKVRHLRCTVQQQLQHLLVRSVSCTILYFIAFFSLISIAVCETILSKV